MRKVAAALTALALAASAAPSGAAAGSGKAVTAPRVGRAGVTVALPKGWHAWVPPGPYAPGADPLTRVVAVSAPFRFAASGCQVGGYAFPSDAVALVVVEWQGRANPKARYAPRPRVFTAKNVPLQPPPAIECFNGSGGSVQFADHGRRFGAYILLGRRAPSNLADRARAVLDTLKVESRR